MITLSGVRSSCDMVDTNSDLSRSAAARSATRRAFWSAIEAWWPSPSARRRWRRLKPCRAVSRPAARKPATQPLRKSGTAIQLPERQPRGSHIGRTVSPSATKSSRREIASWSRGKSSRRKRPLPMASRSPSGTPCPPVILKVPERVARGGAELDHLAPAQAPDDGQVRRVADLARAARLDGQPVRRREAETLALRVPEEDLHARHAHEGHRGLAHGAQQRLDRVHRAHVLRHLEEDAHARRLAFVAGEQVGARSGQRPAPLLLHPEEIG